MKDPTVVQLGNDNFVPPNDLEIGANILQMNHNYEKDLRKPSADDHSFGTLYNLASYNAK